MNSLSWMIYAADVSATVDVLTALTIGATAVGAIVSVSIFSTEDRDNWDTASSDHRCYPTMYTHAPDGSRPGISRPLLGWFRPLLATLGIAAALNVATPSASTFYAIAASEMGERALHTETATKAFKALDAWLDRQIAPASPEVK